MDELERLSKKVTESLVKYVKLDDEYKEKLPKVGEDFPSWILSIESLEELDKLGKAVDEAREEWTSKLREYIEIKNK
jgi:hypothetical protein